MGEDKMVILLKNNNQESIALTHNQVCYFKTKYISMQYNYIWDELASKKIELLYIPTK